MRTPPSPFFFFFNDTATTEIYTLSLHDALPISGPCRAKHIFPETPGFFSWFPRVRSEEHTSELQSPDHLVCRLLLEKKKHHHGPQDFECRVIFAARTSRSRNSNTVFVRSHSAPP